MHINKTLPLAFALAGVAAPAFAVEQGETYLGGGFAMVNYEETIQGDNLDFDPTALVGRIGYGVVDNFAIEGRLGFGLSDDSVSRTDGVNTATATVEVDQIAGVYGVGYLPVSEVFSIYGLAGFTRGELTAKVELNGASLSEASDDDTDFSYGVGAEAGLAQNISGYVEWVSYLDKDDYETTGVSLGAKYSF